MLLSSWVLHQPDFNYLQVQFLKLSGRHKSQNTVAFMKLLLKLRLCVHKNLVRLCHYCYLGLRKLKAGAEREIVFVEDMQVGYV